MSKEIVVSSFPAPIKENPYQSLLYDNLKDYNVELCPKNIFFYKDLARFRKRVDIIHFHWLFDEVNSFKRLIKFLIKLFRARVLGYKIVWTVHNIEHHEHEKYDWIARFFLAHLSNAIIVHGESLKSVVEKRFRIRDKIFVIPHGNYISWYPNKIGRGTARKRLYVDEGTFVYLFFGQIRLYKGLENLIRSFGQIRGDNMLLIVGKPIDEKIQLKIEKMAESKTNIKLHAEFIPDEDVQVFFNAADVVVLPFTKVTTSGSLILALSFGKPIISVNKGVIPEIVTEDIGILIDNPSKLSSAMKEIKNKNLRDMDEKVLKKAREFDWWSIAQAHRKVYEYALNITEK